MSQQPFSRDATEPVIYKLNHLDNVNKRSATGVTPGPKQIVDRFPSGLPNGLSSSHFARC